MKDGGRDLSEDERARFLDNILKDTERASLLLSRLRDLAKAESVEIGGHCRLSEVLADVRGRRSGVKIVCSDEVDLSMSPENALIVFDNLVDNSGKHGADTVKITASDTKDGLIISVTDDGEGISEGNADQIFDLFFTTRRNWGGTGMGLGILRALLKAHGATIKLMPCESGASFELRFSKSAM